MKYFLVLFFSSLKCQLDTRDYYLADLQDQNVRSVNLVSTEKDIIDEMKKDIDNITKVQNDHPTSTLTPQTFDLDAFLKDFGKIQCGSSDLVYVDDKICREFLKEQAFGNLANVQTEARDLYDHLNKNIYKPLGIDFKEQDNLSEMITKSIRLPIQSSIFEHQPLNVNFHNFENSIMSAFMNLNGKLSNVEGNKEAISQLMISILKKCHIYWNSLRVKNQASKAFEDTKTVIQSISKMFLIKDNMIKNITAVLVRRINDTFQKFQKANLMYETIKKEAAVIIGQKIIMRYVNMCDKIRQGEWTPIILLREYNYQTDLIQTYMMMLFYAGKGMSRINNSVQIAIINRLIQNYNEYNRQIVADPSLKKAIKEFTAILLMKLLHKVFLVIKFRPITAFLQGNEVDFYTNPEYTVKILTELSDQLLLIPI